MILLGHLKTNDLFAENIPDVWQLRRPPGDAVQVATPDSVVHVVAIQGSAVLLLKFLEFLPAHLTIFQLVQDTNARMVRYWNLRKLQPHQAVVALECSRVATVPAYVGQPCVQDRRSIGINTDISLPNVLCTIKSVQPTQNSVQI